MAKKRVHEIAKERGIPSKEVLATLQAAGLDVKAAASSVDEGDIARAFDPSASNGGAADEPAAAQTAEGNGQAAAPARQDAQRPTRTEQA
nr:translation initiation factor IF-2 N-terminal domain-containing protein [Thermoleophilaceae bacterium]